MNNPHTPITDTTKLSENEKLNLSITLGGRSAYGFFQYYFNELPHHPTQTDAFNHVNDLYYELFGEYRYESYDTFRKVYTRNLKNNKK
jgi:hypothetical protein